MKILLIILGLLCFGFGTVGVFMPILPTTPFYLAAACCFAKSSSRLHNWFLSTKFYNMNLESLMEKNEMTLKSKIGVMVSVTLLISMGCLLAGEKTVVQVVLVVIWVLHFLYFMVRVKTEKI